MLKSFAIIYWDNYFTWILLSAYITHCQSHILNTSKASIIYTVLVLDNIRYEEKRVCNQYTVL